MKVYQQQQIVVARSRRCGWDGVLIMDEQE